MRIQKFAFLCFERPFFVASKQQKTQLKLLNLKLELMTHLSHIFSLQFQTKTRHIELYCTDILVVNFHILKFSDFSKKLHILIDFSKGFIELSLNCFNDSYLFLQLKWSLHFVLINNLILIKLMLFQCLGDSGLTFSSSLLLEEGYLKDLVEQQAQKVLSSLNQESYYLHVKFFMLLQTESQQLIKEISTIAQDNKEKSISIARMFQIIGNRASFLSKTQSLEQVSLIKALMQSMVNKILESQQDLYEETLAQNNRMLQYFKSQYRIFQQFTKEKLVYIDILSIFFRENLRYITFCKARHRLIPPGTIKLLFGFSNEEVSKLWRVYNSLKSNIAYNLPPQIEEFVLIYQIIALRNKINRLVRKCRINEILQANIYTNYQKTVVVSTDTNIFKYNFCQLAFSTYQRQIQSLNLKRRSSCIRSLIKANQHQSLQRLKTDVLFAKIKYAVNFSSITKFLSLIGKRQKHLILKMIQTQNQSEKTQLQRLLPFMFLNDYTFQKAFSKFKLSQYDIANVQTLSMTRYGLIKAFTKVAFQQSKQLQMILCNMLKVQKLHEKEFIVVKKMTISFQSIMNIPSKASGWAKYKKDDLISNLILITRDSRIKSFAIIRGQICYQQYLSVVKKLMKTIKFSKPFIVVLNEDEMASQLQWQWLYRFNANCIKQYHTKMYVTNRLKYSEISIFLFSWIKASIKTKAKQNLLSQFNFYEMFESQVLLKMLWFRKMSEMPLKK